MFGTLYSLVSAHQLWLSHGAPHSPDDCKLAVVVSNQEVVYTLKHKEVSPYLLPRPLWSLMWHHNFSLLVSQEDLAHLAALYCM